MSVLSSEIIVAIIAVAGSVFGSMLSSRHMKNLITYRLEQVEKKLDNIGNILDRLAKLEIRVDVLEGRK